MSKLNGNRCPYCGKPMITKSVDGSNLVIPKFIKVSQKGEITAKCKRCGNFTELPSSIFRNKKVKYVIKASD